MARNGKYAEMFSIKTENFKKVNKNLDIIKRIGDKIIIIKRAIIKSNPLLKYFS